MPTVLPLRLSLCVLLLVSAVFRTAQSGWSERPNSTYANVEGDSLTVLCESDTIVANYIWTKDGSRLEGGSVIPGLTVNGGSLVIPNLNLTLHNGSYSCIVIEEALSLNLMASFSVFVYYIESDTGTTFHINRIYQECIPDVGRAYVDTSLTLECPAPEGYPPVDVRWYLNSVELTSVTPGVELSLGGRQLVVQPLSTAHAGLYRCEASNEAGARSSEDLDIQVTHYSLVTGETSISLLDSEEPLVVGLGQAAELQSNIFPPVNINEVLWFHNSEIVDVYLSGRFRSVQRSHPEQMCLNALHLINTTGDDQGTYECKIMGPSVSSHATRELLLAVMEGPLVVEATPTPLLAVGRSLILTCRLSTSADPTRNNVPPSLFRYTWTHNGSSNLSPRAARVEGGRRLVISHIQVEDSGVYHCSVDSKPAPTAISALINVTVEAAPSVTISLLGSDSVFDRVDKTMIFVQLGARVTFKCKIDSSRPSNISWFRKVGGVDALYSMSTSLSDSSTLTLSPLTPSLLTSYSCHASNIVHDNLVSEGRTLRETDESYVRDAAAGVQGVKFRNGTTLELTCEARGVSAEGIVWMRGGEQLTNQITAGGSSIVIATNGNNSTLTIFGVTTREAGLFECSLIGTPSTRVFNVTITVPARIEYTSSPLVTVVIGDKVQFDCVASGIPPPTIKWLFDTQPVEEVENLRDLGNGSLRISSVTKDHEGSYHCFLALENGQLSQEFTLTVEEGGEEDRLLCGGEFARGDCITILSGGSMAVFLLALTLLVLLFCFCILFYRRTRTPSQYPREFEMKRDFSSRASSHKDSGAAPVFEDTNGFGEPQGFRNGLYSVQPPLAMFDRAAAAVSEVQRSVTPPAPSPVLQTPGTGGTGSMFSSDDQSSLTTLPNYPRTKLTLGAQLGEGEFGPVVLGVARNIVSHEETTQVVVKVLVRSGDGEDQFQPDLALVDFANQMRIDYEHIACILGLCTDTEPYYVIYEYLDQGDLKKYLIANRPVPGRPTPLSPHTLSRLVLQVADGMAFLFSQRIIHGDLATRNCLVSSDNHVKIADLGIGHDLYQTDYYDNGSQLLPIRWMPPELLVATDDGPAFSLHSDIWSFGVLCWEVFSFGELPFEGVADEEVLMKVPQGVRLSLPPSDTCPAHMTRAMLQCWQLEPESRPRFSALCMEMNVISED